MAPTITGFHRDAVGDWVAELSCGHDQHVRHRPPFQERPWVIGAAGREARLGTPLPCALCDRAEPPEGLRPVRSGPTWTEDTMPRDLLEAHTLAPGTWGSIRVHQGVLRFSMSCDPPLRIELGPGSPPQPIVPAVVHQLQPLGPVRFVIDLFAVER
jgi:tellurite methyltransferase